MALGRTISIRVKRRCSSWDAGPLVAYLLLYNFFTMEAVNEKALDSCQTTLQLCCANVEDELAVIECSMPDLVMNNVDFALLHHDGAGELPRSRPCPEQLRALKFDALPPGNPFKRCKISVSDRPALLTTAGIFGIISYDV